MFDFVVALAFDSVFELAFDSVFDFVFAIDSAVGFEFEAVFDADAVIVFVVGFRKHPTGTERYRRVPSGTERYPPVLLRFLPYAVPFFPGYHHLAQTAHNPVPLIRSPPAIAGM